MRRYALSLSVWLLSLPALADTATVLVEEGALKLDEADISRMFEHALPARLSENARHNRNSFENLLKEYVLFRQLELEAQKAGLDQDEKILAQIEMQRLTTLSSAVIERILQQLPLPDFADAALERFKTAEKPFVAPDEVHARHILVAVDDKRTAEDALKRAEEVRAKLVADETAFAELVREYSDDPGARHNRGDLGYFTADRMVRPFSEAAFALKDGEISQPVRSEFGYHIIQTLAHKPGAKLAFDDVKMQLIAEERREFYQRERQKLIEHFTERESLQYNQQAIDDFYQRFSAAKED